MPIPANMHRIVLTGGLPGGVDSWNIVLHAQDNSADFPDGFDQGYCQEAVDSFATIMFHAAGVGGDFATSTTIEKADLYTLDETNHVTEVFTAAVTVDPAHGATATALPPEVSVCASLSGGLPGRSRNGRSYLPGLSTLALGGDGTLSADAPGDLSAQYAAYLSSLNAFTGGGAGAGRFALCILSVTHNMVTPILEVKVGDVFDVQRRRRNGGPETYTTADVTPAV